MAPSSRRKQKEDTHPYVNDETIRLIKKYTTPRTYLGLGRYGAYKDYGESMWRIGYGSTKLGKRFVRFQERANEDAIEKQLIIDVREFSEKVAHYIQMPINQKRRTAIISYAFSIGLGQFKTCYLLELINRKASKNEIIKEWSPYINRQYLNAPALIRDRRRTELNLYLAPDKEIPTFVPHNCIARNQCLLNMAETWTQTPNQIKAIEYLERKFEIWDPTGESLRRFWRYWNENPGALGSPRNL